jgi:hypothetical protein
VADGIVLERSGIPTASICTDSFQASGDAMAKLYGFPGYRYAIVPHPLASLTIDELRDRAKEALPQVLHILGIGA